MTCGQCIYWHKTYRHTWGLCEAPLPQWTCEIRSRGIFADNLAENCECYRESTSRRARKEAKE